jgi:hypothetical protein
MLRRATIKITSKKTLLNAALHLFFDWISVLAASAKSLKLLR